MGFLFCIFNEIPKRSSRNAGRQTNSNSVFQSCGHHRYQLTIHQHETLFDGQLSETQDDTKEDILLQGPHIRISTVYVGMLAALCM